jgi:hypothetical protein
LGAKAAARVSWPPGPPCQLNAQNLDSTVSNENEDKNEDQNKNKNKNKNKEREV